MFANRRFSNTIRSFSCTSRVVYFWYTSSSMRLDFACSLPISSRVLRYARLVLPLFAYSRSLGYPAFPALRAWAFCRFLISRSMAFNLSFGRSMNRPSESAAGVGVLLNTTVRFVQSTWMAVYSRIGWLTRTCRRMR